VLAELGFRIATLASNHTFDQGPFGVTDTVDELHRLGLETAGAGATLDAARCPAIVEADGVTVGVLSYNAVGPRESWATSVKAGAAYVRISQREGRPLRPPLPGGYSFNAPLT
jgi:poly-gamma-glutamate synthesis protein (capsule biosynthesis protein)